MHKISICTMGPLHSRRIKALILHVNVLLTTMNRLFLDQYKILCFKRQDNKMFYLYFCAYPKILKGTVQMYRRIRDMREGSDLLQTKNVAEYLQCTQVSYSHYKLGKRDIPTDVLIKLAKLYKASTDYLLGLTDGKNPYPQARR